jgi:hypothetical protein
MVQNPHHKSQSFCLERAQPTTVFMC